MFPVNGDDVRLVLPNGAEPPDHIDDPFRTKTKERVKVKSPPKVIWVSPILDACDALYMASADVRMPHNFETESSSDDGFPCVYMQVLIFECAAPIVLQGICSQIF